MKKRCFWVNLNNQIYVEYHDKEWGRPIHDDCLLFEMLILEGAQAGLSWETVLNKRVNYRKLFYNFDIIKCSKLRPDYLEKVLLDPSIIRNRLKVFSIPINAKAFINIQNEFGSFDSFIWGFVENKPLRFRRKNISDYPTRSDLSDKISKELKSRGFKFIGTTIIYAYLQAIGILNEHSNDCFLC